MRRRGLRRATGGNTLSKQDLDMEQQEPLGQDAPDAAPQAEEPVPPQAEEATNPLLEELEALKSTLAEQEEKFLRLAAEYENFRKRSQKEKESAWTDARAETVKAFLPVYDNLERALKQETCDAAYAKGVEMTMAGLREVLSKLGIAEIPALGQAFDPNFHNAVMHIEDAAVGENMVVEVFQTGFQAGEKIVRFAMVKVAN